VADLFETLTERLADRPALDVNADLQVQVEDDTLHVESYTDRVVVTVPSVTAGLRVLRGGGLERLGSIESVTDLLAATGMSAEVRVGPRPVARLGADVTPGLVARAVGWGPVRLSPLGLLLAATVDSPDGADQGQ
jgi:hypothetical protein